MKIPRLIFLLIAVSLLVRCAGSTDTSDDPSPPEVTPSNDDTHGWGANISGVGKH